MPLNLSMRSDEMRKIVFYGVISLDGFLADEQDNLQWLFDTDLEDVSTYEDFEKHVDTIAMGRVTYEETQKIIGDTLHYLDKKKIVFSRSRTGNIVEGKYTSENPVSLLSKLREEKGKWIWIVGGGGIFSELLEANMIDEYWIQIAPVLLGKGKRLFKEGNYAQRLEFIETTQMGEMTELHFKKKMHTHN